VRLRAAIIDEVMVRAWRRWQLVESPHALLAVGGYGRSELLPYSDVDICILLADPLDEATRERVSGLITFLWDISLEVGHSVRTIPECVSAAAEGRTRQCYAKTDRNQVQRRPIFG